LPKEKICARIDKKEKRSEKMQNQFDEQSMQDDNQQNDGEYAFKSVIKKDMKNRNEIMNMMLFEVWMQDINGDRLLACFRYKFSAEEFIELQYARHKPARFYIFDTRNGTREDIEPFDTRNLKGKQL
jgi:hypothetical protein